MLRPFIGVCLLMGGRFFVDTAWFQVVMLCSVTDFFR